LKKHVKGVYFEFTWIGSLVIKICTLAAKWQLQPKLLALICLPYLQEVHSTSARGLEANWAPV